MDDLFSFDKTQNVSTKEKGNTVLIKRERKKKLRAMNRDAKAAQLLDENGGFPKQDEFYAIITSGETDAGSFFSYALENWEEITELHLATWTISRANVKRLVDALESGKVKHLTFVISNTMKPANPGLYNNLILSLKHFTQVKIKECPSHAKTFSMWDGKENYITVSGSANWSENPRKEDYLIFNDEKLFNHNKDWMNSLN